MSQNGTMMQYFEWYLPEDQSLWNTAAEQASHLHDIGITAVWLPPAYKGQAGIHDVGYGVYDTYDLGEFDQKGTVPTKYGTKEQYLQAVKTLQENQVQVYADIVLNHRMGADGTEEVRAVENNPSNRMEVISGVENIQAWTSFTFPGRAGKYSQFTWNHNHFDGVDWDQGRQRSAIYNFEGNPWETGVDDENQNYDYLMGADLNFKNQEVLEEMDRWGQWYLDMVGMDGFRLDAVKHIDSGFFSNWLGKLRQNNGKELFTVGEYWSPELADLKHYIDVTGGCMSLFDVPLHMNFFHACNSGGTFDMAHLLDGSLVQSDPMHAVTFVENHDTQAGQALQTVVADWFKPLAYAVILLREQGYPCVFYGDYYGVPAYEVAGCKDDLDVMCQMRRDKIYGPQHDYFDHFDIVGWTVEGDQEHHNSGAAVLLSDGPDGSKNMYIGTGHAGQTYVDSLGHCTNEVVIQEDGIGTFTVKGGSVSVWVRK